MQVINEYPPNYQEIKKVINSPEDAFYPYGDKLYNPSGIEIPADIMYHEEIHAKQQKEFINPGIWWQKWLYDEEFREQMEVEAFAHQYAFVKKFYHNKAVKEALEEFAEKLAINYKLNINIYQAATLIRKCPV